MNDPAPSFLFDWSRPAWNYHLVVLLVASLTAHVGTFYFFYILYPATTSLLPPSAQVSLLNPKTPEDLRLLQWAELKNAAASSVEPRSARFISQFIPPYKPNFATETPALIAEPAPAPATPKMPSVFPIDTLLPLRQAPIFARQEQKLENRLQPDETLRRRWLTPGGALPARVPALPPTVYLIGVGPSGKADYSYLWSSSGNREADHAAEEMIRQLAFRPAAQTDWGFLRIVWGAVEASN